MVYIGLYGMTILTVIKEFEERVAGPSAEGVTRVHVLCRTGNVHVTYYSDGFHYPVLL